MTTLKIGRLNVTVEKRLFGFHDVLVTNDKGVVLHVEEDIYSRSTRQVKYSEEYEEAVIFAERYNLLLEMADQALEKCDMETLNILANWMDEMKGV